MYRPEFLKPQDKIYILSTARKIDMNALSPFLDWVKFLGYIPVLGHSLSLEDNQYAGTDQERVADFQRALDSPEYKVIWFARGGYGSIRIFDFIDWDEFIQNPKWLIGFSDITIWHNLVNQFYGIQTIHALMPLTFENNTKEAIHATASLIQGNLQEIRWDYSRNNTNIKNATGELVGGNLSILYSLIGTKTGFNANGKILYIEDIDEYLYHIDRMMIALKNSGKLEGLKALLVGEFHDIKDNAVPFGKSYQEIIIEHTASFGYPVFFEFPAGHIDHNMPIIFGAEVSIESSIEQVVLSYK